MNVLYVGSGRSALQVANLDRSNCTTCAVNNAWRLFTSPFEYWIHSGDFPQKNYPVTKNWETEVSYKEYQSTSDRICDQLFPGVHQPYHHLGYTIFFQGLYWIIHTLRPESIYMLGFDHDYDPQKVRQWTEAGRPTPQNQFQGLGQDYFVAQDLSSSFYGSGTPDPMRLGEAHLREKFRMAAEYSERLGVRLYNASGITSGLNNFPQKPFPT
jgi:hypothetical protein